MTACKLLLARPSLVLASNAAVVVAIYKFKSWHATRGPTKPPKSPSKSPVSWQRQEQHTTQLDKWINIRFLAREFAYPFCNPAWVHFGVLPEIFPSQISNWLIRIFALWRLHS